MIDRSGCLKWEERGRIGIIQISGTPSNPVTRPNFADIDILRQWIEREKIQGVVVTGNGRHFSAGADLEYFKKCRLEPESLNTEFEAGRAILDYLEGLEKPVAASIDGICFGAGLEIALACHMRFCSKGAVFGFPEINHGIIPGLGGVKRLVETSGKARAMEMILTGDVFNAEYALDTGIVNRVVEDKSALGFTVEMLDRIAGRGVKPVTYAIRAIHNSDRMDFHHAVKEECRMFAALVIDQFGGGVKEYA